MRKEETRQIGSYQYTFYQLSATEGLKTWLRIVKIIGKPVGMLADKAVRKQDILTQEVSELQIDKIVQALCENIQVDDVIDIIKQLLSQVMYEGKRVSDIFDVHFAGNYNQILEVVYAALEVNYKDFLLEIMQKLGVVNN